MQMIPTFEQLLRRVEERSAAFRSAVVGVADVTADDHADGNAVPSGPVRLDTKVPSCPEWTLGDLVVHLGEVHGFWAATVAAGPAATAPSDVAFTEPAVGPQADGTEGMNPQSLAAWSLAATEELLAALRAAGPEGGSWTWWGASDAPRTAEAVARHQVAEALVHTYDAQLAGGREQSLPVPEALDAVDEFLHVGCGAVGPWPHEPATLVLRAAEGPAWQLELTAEGARTHRLPSALPAPGSDVAALTAPGVAALTAHGTASDLVLALYGRIPPERLELTGDREVLTRLLLWQPSE
ncbi:maleylpyruvate isomerase family mycothiol-dependent enzyme [Streptacidiphilus jiangxiensis]|uniref:TIGR03083 family protein n=1 Tax=Streptacidiphilus jiangxiensis TaxID=235985 RepID=A0A1H7FAS7_STRJI|nr:maleylpyruvate isomerase family mycothiol-dependent enzyme [Streptacidiphilus jiangxiensis]SEK23078.1 TIGR03083 family protein [Streptacidiphilus jiangxiensis]